VGVAVQSGESCRSVRYSVCEASGSVARSRDLSLFEGFLERKGTKGFLEKMRDFFREMQELDILRFVV